MSGERAARPASDVVTAIRRALAARERIVAGASNERLARALAAAARAWRGTGGGGEDDRANGRAGATPDPDRCARSRAATIALIAERSSVHPDLVAHGLELTLSAIDERGIADLLAQAESAAALERAVERYGRRMRLLGPPVVFHSVAGNVTGLALPAVVAGVLARSVTVVRDSSRQPALTAAFAATLAEVDADVAAMIVPARWPAGDVAHEREVLALVDRAELWGASETVADVRRRHAALRDMTIETVERGSRWSAGLIPAHVDGEPWADAFALDVVLHDGLGCLTPDAIFVAGASDRADRFAAALARSLAALEQRWPRRPRELEVEAARRAFLDRCEALTLEDGRLRRGRNDAWVVALTHWEAIAGPGLRCVRVIACADDGDALAALARPPAPLAAVAVAGAGSRRDLRSRDVARRAAELGATLVCAPGRMQAPPLAWRQDGRPRLGDLLSWRPEPPVRAPAGIDCGPDAPKTATD